MREIKRESLVEISEVLLFDIREILLDSKELLQKLVNQKSSADPKPEIIIENKIVSMPCKYCGGTHEKSQQIAACAKKNNKG